MIRSAVTIVAVAGSWFTAFAADTRTVQADFDRCAQVIERVERSIRRYEDDLAALRRNLSRVSSDQRETVAREFQVLENRLEYFRNRLERSRGQADKIRDDLKNVSGPACPSCVESSVNLYCRSGETLRTDIDEYLGKAADLRGRIGMSAGSSANDYATHFEERRAAADSLYRSLNAESKTCADKAAATLLKQASINLARSDSLHAAGDTEGAGKTLGIARSLLDNAAQRCGVEE